MFGRKLDVGAPEGDFGGGHASPSFGPGWQTNSLQFGIGILTKRICYYPLLLLNRYFSTNDYYSPISTRYCRDCDLEIIGDSDTRSVFIAYVQVIP